MHCNILTCNDLWKGDRLHGDLFEPQHLLKKQNPVHSRQVTFSSMKWEAQSTETVVLLL